MKYLRALIYIYCYVELVPGGGRHLLQLNLPRYSNKCEAFLNTNISSSALLLLDKVWNCCETSAVHFWKQMWFHLKYPPEHFIASRFCNRSFQFRLKFNRNVDKLLSKKGVFSHFFTNIFTFWFTILQVLSGRLVSCPSSDYTYHLSFWKTAGWKQAQT